MSWSRLAASPAALFAVGLLTQTTIFPNLCGSARMRSGGVLQSGVDSSRRGRARSVQRQPNKETAARESGRSQKPSRLGRVRLHEFPTKFLCVPQGSAYGAALMKGRLRRLVKGKTDPSKRHIRLHRWLMDSVAWQTLDTASRSLLVELYALYNGSNNGFLFLSLREAARRANLNKDTAGRGFKTLQDRGFIRRRADEPVHFNLREARYWILTEFQFPSASGGDGAGTRDFKIQNRVRNEGTARPKRGDKIGGLANDLHKMSETRGQKRRVSRLRRPKRRDTVIHHTVSAPARSHPKAQAPGARLTKRYSLQSVI